MQGDQGLKSPCPLDPHYKPPICLDCPGRNSLPQGRLLVLLPHDDPPTHPSDEQEAGVLLQLLLPACPLLPLAALATRTPPSGPIT